MMLIRCLLIIFSFSASLLNISLARNIEDYLKKVGEKTGSHGLRNVDCAYIINLDKRPEKLKSCTDQLTPYGIFPVRFSAVNGWELSLETLNDVGVKYGPKMTSTLRGTTYLPKKLEKKSA